MARSTCTVFRKEMAATTVTWRAFEATGEPAAREVLETLLFRDSKTMQCPNPPLTRPRPVLVHDLGTSGLAMVDPALLWL